VKTNFLILSSEDKDLLDNIYNTLSFADTSKAFYNGSFNKDRIQIVRFSKYVEDLDLPSLRIPIGFLDFVQSVMKDYEHTLIDDRKPIQEIEVDDIENLEGVELVEHQIGAIYKALGRRRGIVRAPTAAGKTEIFLAILNMLETPSLVLFNRKQLAVQTVERAAERGLDVGLVQGPHVNEKKITMASIQSIHKIKSLAKYKNLILDEVHNCGSKSYQRVLKLAHWERVYGFSATPVNPKLMNLRSAKLIAYVGPVIYDVSAKELMEAEFIAKPKIFMLPIDQPDDIEDANYKEAEMLGLIYNPYRNNLIRKLAEQHIEEKVLILTKYIDQGQAIGKLLPDAEFIWHEVSVADRNKAIERFEKGELKILIASRILDEGIDIKNFKVLIIASAGISFIKTIQRLGRGLRVTEDKKNITVYDFMDNTNSRLLKHSRTRKKTYKMFGYDDIVVVKELSDGTVK
jgi:superfamily II DNA or RNA helicase